MQSSLLQRVVIHCNPSVLDNEEVKNGSLYYEHSKQFDNEIDIYVVDSEDHDDARFCNSFGIDYETQVNRVELLSRM